ncbi:MAG: hypothetical protein M1828_000361 [Chrysothrix sp. TS-e1954]|nr:MAG: hypothetical protein M1828_000361 [Chrysothrix sp. TS-e1954]
MSDRAATFDFKDVSDFSLIDNIRGRSISPSLDGKVVVMPGDAIQKSDVRVIVSMESTDHDFLDEVSFVQTDNKLAIEVIQAPPVLRGPEGAECTILNVLLLPRPGLILDNFGIMTRHFSVMLMKDLKLSIREQTNVAALGGSVTSLVDAHVFHSTSTRIHTSVGSINGTIPFDESLTLRTTSGDIGMSIQGTSHDGYKPPRANFTASSTSGNINITFPSPPAERLHCAGCNIHVSTTSGSISGHFIQGLHTKLESISGLIDGSIRALDRYPSSIRLNTVSLFNRTTLQVLKPAHSLFESMKNITSYHKSISGDIRVSYPESWEGRLDGSTLSGELLVRGARIERKTSNFISAIHGDGDSKIGFSTVNGNVNITIGTDSS